MKKLVSLALALVLVLSLTACGSKDGGDSADPNLGKYLGAEFSADGNEWLSLDEVHDEGESYIELKAAARACSVWAATRLTSSGRSRATAP